MTSVDSKFNFLCGRPHGAGPPPPSTCVHMSLTLPLRVDVINGWPLTTVFELSKRRWGSKFFFRWGVERRGGGQHFFSTQGEKEVEGRILSSIIEERGTWWRLG